MEEIKEGHPSVSRRQAGLRKDKNKPPREEMLPHSGRFGGNTSELWVLCFWSTHYMPRKALGALPTSSQGSSPAR